MRNAIKFRQAQNAAKTPVSTSSLADVEGQTLVGFGTYKHMSRSDLFNSTQDEHRNYVNSILTTPVTHPGGQLDKLKRYLRDRKQGQEDDNSLVQAVLEAEREHAANAQASSSQEKVTIK